MTSRHISVKAARHLHTELRFPRFLRDRKLDPVLKRAALRWSIYNFPVRHIPSREELGTLRQIEETDDLTEYDYMRWKEALRVLFNKEQEVWGLWKLSFAHIMNVRCRLRS